MWDYQIHIILPLFFFQIFHYEPPLKASFSLLFVVPKLQKSMGDLALMRLGMVANTISVAFFGIVWQPWQADPTWLASCWCLDPLNSEGSSRQISPSDLMKSLQKSPKKPKIATKIMADLQVFLPPLGCILAFAVFPTANSLASASAAPTQAATAQGLISGARTLAEGVSPVLFGGGLDWPGAVQKHVFPCFF